MSTSLKRIARTLVAVVLSMTALCVLAGVTEAQNAPAGPVEDTQSTNQDVEATTILWPAASEPAVRLVVPGDSLWLIAQEHLGPDATPGRVMNEVELLYELNRDQIGDDPNLIFPGQKLLLPPENASAPVAPMATEPLASQEPTLASPPAAERAAEQIDESISTLPDLPEAETKFEVRSVREPPADVVERRQLGLVVLALTLILAILIIRKLLIKRDVGDAQQVWRMPEGYRYPADHDSSSDRSDAEKASGPRQSGEGGGQR